MFILNSRRSHPILGHLMLNTLRFGAKCTAFWCKMECVLVLNALRFGAKWRAFWCKTQGKMVQNAVQFPAKCRSMRINIR